MKAELNRLMDYPHRELAAMAQSREMVRHHFVRVDDPAALDTWLTRHAQDNIFASLGRFREPDPKSPYLYDECVFDLGNENLRTVREDALKLFDLLWKHLEIHPQRIVQWNTATKLRDGRAKCFMASSPVLVVCNRTLLDNEDMGAILDRGDAIEFDPPKAEVIAKLKTYADDPEIVALLEAMPVVPSLRTYEKAKAWKKSRHLDLKQELFAECGVCEHVQILIEIITTEPKERHLELYMHRTGCSRRDYFNQLPLARQLVATAGDSLALLN